MRLYSPSGTGGDVRSMRRLNRGFTLLELLVVISLIGLLVTIGSVSYTSAQKKSRDARRKGDMKAVQNGFEQFYAGNTRYPKTSGEGGGAMVGGLPTDPKNTGTYVYTFRYDATNGISYCACGLLETGSGNATSVPAGSSCNWGPGNYFCVGNLQ